MTAPLLLALIVAALMAQVAVAAMLHLRRRAALPDVVPEPAQPAPVAAGAWAGWRAFRVVRRAYEDAQRSQCSFYLQPVDAQPLPPFKPGQFLTFQLQVPDAAAPGAQRMLTRCYSLSDRPQPEAWRVTIKRVPAPAGRPDLPPGASSSHFHDHVQVGDVLQVRAPSGHFHIDADSQVPVVLIGGGIGITPMMSMLRWCQAEQPARSVHLYYGVRHGGELAYTQVLKELAASHAALRLHIAFSDPRTEDEAGRDFQHQGRIDVELLRRTLPHGRHQFYICGPAAMMDSLVPALQAWGVPEADIHFEAFGPASVKAGRTAAQAVPDAAVEVRFQRSGRTLVWDGQDASLLDFAERHGVAVESGCRSGGCGACETRLVAGSVRYAQTPDHDVARGHCLLCVGRPASAVVLEA